MITLTEKQKNQFTLLGTILLGMLVAFSFSHALLQWASDWRLSTQPITTSTILPTPTTRLNRDLPNAHLFGLPPMSSKLNSVPITSLQLSVTGIIKMSTEQGNNPSKAMISIAGKPSKVYQIGDTLPVGVKVYAITNYAVVLENNHRLEKLPLHRPLLWK